MPTKKLKDNTVIDEATGEVVEGQALAPVQPLPVANIKQQIDGFLEARAHLLDRILPLMVPGTDFYDIRGKKSLGKPGAEKIAGIYRYAATFQVDRETMACLPDKGEWIAFVCTLTRDGELQGEGRGAETLKEAQGDPNKMIKMAQKSAFVDAVIRATGISDLFTQDIEHMPNANIGRSPARGREPERETPSAKATPPPRAAKRPVEWAEDETGGMHTPERKPTTLGQAVRENIDTKEAEKADPITAARKELDFVLSCECVTDADKTATEGYVARNKAKGAELDALLKITAHMKAVLKERKCLHDLPF